MLSKQVRNTILLIWPLLTGVAMIMVGNGLQGTLLAIRAEIEGFPLLATGMIMSLYYAGFLVGCYLVPKMIFTVGHIRVFAAMASLASTTILIHGVVLDPWMWSLVRIFSGISFAGLFIVTESWMNNIAPNKYRGEIFSLYIFVIYGGLSSGQLLMNVAPPEGIDLFIIISILVSLSLIPVTLADKPAPGYETPESLPFKKIFRKSPLSVAGVLSSGLCNGAMHTMGVIYATQIGMATGQAALYIAIYILGSALVPLAVGWLSDRVDRRNVIIGVLFFAFCCTAFAHGSQIFYLITFAYGGLMGSLYSVSIAYLNDQIKSSQIVSATTSMILLSSAGACLGPLLAGWVLGSFGTAGFFASMGVVLFVVLTFACYRAIVGEKIDIEDQSDFVPVPTRSAPAVMNIVEED